MHTKTTGDIAEHVAVLHALKRGWGVLRPIGDRLPNDLVFDVNGALIKIQVKSAWCDSPSAIYVVYNRGTNINRKCMVREPWTLCDVGSALAYVAIA